METRLASDDESSTQETDSDFDRHPPPSTDETRIAPDLESRDELDPRGPKAKSRALGRGDGVGRYLVVSRLGQGGMGIVYAAYDPELDRRVAVKVLRPRGKSKEAATARLLREAQAMAKLSHPNVVSVFDVGQHDGSVFVAMDFVEGETLEDWMDRGPHSEVEVLERFRAAGRGLAAAHAVGLVHRDFKPANVLLGAEGRVVVADFGLARTPEDDATTSEARVPPRPRIDDDLRSGAHTALQASLGATSTRTRSGAQISVSTRVTETGAFLGTPAYMSPEQFEGREVDPRSDQFSFAIALWEALCGERPFAGENARSLMFNVLQGERRELPSGARVSRRVRAVLDRALASKPDERWPDMSAMLRALEPPAYRRWIAPAALALLGVGAVAYGQLEGRDAPTTPVCQADSDALAQLWNPAESERLAAVIAGIDDPRAPAMAATIRAAIDSWAADWNAAHLDACEDTRVRGTQSEQALDTRMLCLDRRLRRFEATKALLAEADPKLLGKADALVDGLDDLEACADPERVAQLHPAPTDPAARAALASVQGTLEEVTTLRLAGRYEPARAKVEAALAESEGIEDSRLRAEVDFERGRVASDLLEHEPAHEFLYDAFRAALAAGDDMTAARAAAALVTTSDDLERKEGADRWHGIAMALSQRLGDSPAVRATTLTNYANHVRGRGEAERALELHSEARDAYAAAYGEDSMRVADATFNQATAAYDLGHYEDAAAKASEALAIWRARVGESHPRVLSARSALAIFQLQSGDFAGALASQGEIVTAYERLYGPDSIKVADALLNRSAMAVEAEAYEDARAWVERGLAIYEKAEKTDDIGYVQLLGNASMIALRRKQLDEAETLARRALARFTEMRGAEHPNTATAHIILAEILLAGAKPSDALVELEAAGRAYDASLPAEHPSRIEVHGLMAQAHLDRGNVGAARAALDAAAPLIENADASAMMRGDYWKRRRQVEAEAGDATKAAAALEQALAAYAEAGASGAKAAAALRSDLEG